MSGLERQPRTTVNSQKTENRKERVYSPIGREEERGGEEAFDTTKIQGCGAKGKRGLLCKSPIAPST